MYKLRHVKPEYTIFLQMFVYTIFKMLCIFLCWLQVLTKSYKMKCEPDEDDPFAFEGPEIISTSGYLSLIILVK